MKKSTRNAWTLLASVALLFAGLTDTTFAQKRTVEEKPTGPVETKVDTRDSTVAYIEGDHLVVRLQDGRLEALRIPSEERFDIDGQKLALHELKPGMLLTEETFSTTRPVIVKTVEIVDGTVWHAGPGRLIVKTREGKIVDYRIVKWATVNINGKEQNLVSLRHGEPITATIITESPVAYEQREVRKHGHQRATQPAGSQTTAPPES